MYSDLSDLVYQLLVFTGVEHHAQLKALLREQSGAMGGVQISML